MTTEETINSFPSQFVPPTVKASKNYAKQQSDAFHQEGAYQLTEASLCRNNKNYARYRAYGRGEQSQNQYKELQGLKRSKESAKTGEGSYRNINFEILKVAPKIRNVVINKVINQPLSMKATPVDPKSISARRQYKSALLEFIINKEEIERFEQLTKLGLERPVAPGEIPPSSASELDPYMDMNPKDITSLEVLDFIKQCFAENDWNQLSQEIVGDIVDLGIGGTRQYIDVNNKIKFRRLIIENCISNKCIYPDFRDIIRFGEYVDMTVSDLKRATKNAWGEDIYKEIANKTVSMQNSIGATSRTGYNGRTQEYFNQSSYSYSYDHEKVKVLHSLWYSVDTEVHVEYMNDAGNRRVKQEAFNYVPFRGDKSVNDGKGMSDEEYNKFNLGKKKIYRTEVRNVYQASWVVGTDYVYDYGLMPNMLRSSGNWQDTIMPITLVTTDFVSTMGLIEQPLDQVQLNYLQFQSHVSASKPPGIAIEKHALARIGKGGQGGKKWDPKEDLIMFAETGNLVYDGYDAHDNYLGMLPFKELANGLSPGAQDHYGLMLQFIDLIRSMLGLNIMTEGQTPPERMGKSVAQMSFGATDNALSHLTKAYRSIYERTARNIFYLLQNNVQRMDSEMLSESLGAESYKYFTLNQDLGLLDMGIILEEGPDDIVKERVSQTLNLMVENGQIPGEDAVLIQMQDNPYRQVLMLRKHRKEKEEQDAERQMQIQQAQAQGQQQMAIAAEQEKQKADEIAFKHKIQEKEFDAMIARQAEQMRFTHEIVLKKLELNHKSDLSADQMIHEYLQQLIDHQHSLKEQKLTNEKATSNA